MNLSELIEEYKEAIHDYDSGIDLEAKAMVNINEAMGLIAEDVEMATLRKMTVVNTDITAPYLVMPVDFSGRIVYLGDSDGEIRIYKSLKDLIIDYPSLDNIGDVEAVAIENKLLYYQGIPSESEALTVLYYADPPALTKPHDVPDWLPEYLHRGLIVNKAAELKYREIEEGIEGEMVNTMKYKGYYEESKNMLELWLSRRRSHVGTSVWAN